jgi:hypothetical protein
MADTLKVTRAPETVVLPQLKVTPKGTLEPKTVGRPVLADLVLGINYLRDPDGNVDTSVIGLKLFPHKEKLESYHLAEVYVLGGPPEGDLGYLGSLALCRVDFPGGQYDIQFDDELVAKVRDVVFPGPQAFKKK